jgi:pimeloyl-ACP methyl ester carboxylesterase
MSLRNRILILLCALAMVMSACQPVSPVGSELATSSPETAMPKTTAEIEAEPTATAIPPEPVEFIELTLVGVDVLTGEVTSPALANKVSDPETRKVMIQLPPDYASSDKRYPVVYVLHYYTGSEISHVVEVGRAMNKLLDSGDVKEMILVYPDASNKFRGSKYLSSPTIGDYETYLTQDLVNFIDTNFRTLAQRESRGITGCSMGGDGAMHLALAYPDVYSVAAPVSSTPDNTRDPVWEEARVMFQGPPADFREFQYLPWKVQYAIATAAAVAPNPEKPPFYLDIPYELVNGEAQIVTEVL